MNKRLTSEQAKGTIKKTPEDFIVEEIAENGTVMELGKKYSAGDLGFVEEDGVFTLFVLQKREWNTIQALRAIAKRFRRGIKSVGFAGTKDRISVSTQLCSIYGIKPAQLEGLHIKDLSINGAWSSSKGIKLGDLLGNRFIVTVSDIASGEFEKLEKASSELLEYGVFPNYFGQQRFGARDNNFEIGLSMLKGDFKTAAMLFLTDTRNELSIDAIEARKRLAEELDFKKALSYFPRYLKYERLVIEYLSKYENYANALRRLPRSLALMFVHSVEDKIFNMELDERMEEKAVRARSGDIVCSRNELFCDIGNIHGFAGNKDELPVASIIGYDSKPNDFERDVLEMLGVSTEDFKMKSMPELNCKGSYRVLFAPFSGFSLERISNSTARVSFSLPSGSYATVFMDELLVSDSARSDSE